MQFSVFTPTHNPIYLSELYACLKQQNNSDWEWVILENTADTDDDDWHNTKSSLLKDYIPEAIFDKRVTVSRAPIAVAEKGIGALKKYACGLCKGDYLVEIDHDDLVREDLFSHLSNAIAESTPDVVFSDFAEFNADGSPHVYSPDSGWESYHTTWNGNDYIAMVAFDADPSSLSRIWYAPNHVRCFKRDAYLASGGHNENLTVCDDHELLCRMYSQNYKFHHVPECLYFYRLLPASTDTSKINTYIKHNAKIQVDNVAIGNAYLEPMILSWAKRHGGIMLDMGGAHGKPAGYLSVDMWGDPDIKLDITKEPLPFGDNEVSVIRCSDFLEHIKPEFVVSVMNEFYRVLKPGGYLITHTPAFPSKASVQDPTHVSFWCSNSFWYYSDTPQLKYNHEFKGLFHVLLNQEVYPDEWCVQYDIKFVDCIMVKLAGNKVAGSRLSLITSYEELAQAA